MGIPDSLIVEVATLLERFGIKAPPAQVASLAGFYWLKRPSMPVREIAEAMIGVPQLPWPVVLHKSEGQVKVMALLIERLDEQYWVDTFEHDRARVAD